MSLEIVANSINQQAYQLEGLTGRWTARIRDISIEKKFSHPHDTVVSSGLRFLSELITWIAGPWAVATYSSWLVLPVLIILVGLPSIFSTENDKNRVVVPTPGPIRVAIEFFLFAVAAVAPWFVWPPAVSGVAVGIVIATIVAGASRTRWLIRGAPIENESE